MVRDGAETVKLPVFELSRIRECLPPHFTPAIGVQGAGVDVALVGGTIGHWESFVLHHCHGASPQGVCGEMSCALMEEPTIKRGEILMEEPTIKRGEILGSGGGDEGWREKLMDQRVGGGPFYTCLNTLRLTRFKELSRPVLVTNVWYKVSPFFELGQRRWR